MWDSGLLVTKDESAGAKLREWSSLIGIVTAIVGNILISFALNIQRYAHIRLAREHHDRVDAWDSGLLKGGHKSYGTQQNQIAEERAKINLNAAMDGEQEPAEGEVQDIRKSSRTRTRNGRTIRDGSPDTCSSSGSTVKPSEKGRPQADKKTYLRSPYWWGGIVLMIIGEAGNFIAYGFAPASIVSPLGVVALVSNCIIAPALLKEQFRQRDFWGVALAIAGAVVIVISAKNSENKMGPDDLLAAITRWEFETYLGITAGLIIVLMWASGRYGEKTVLIDLGLVGLFGGYTALSTKGVASLLSDTLWRALTFPITYPLVFILVATALMQIRYVNRALQRFDSTQVIPIQFVLFTISVIIGSAVLYRDFESATGDRIGKFVGGCLLTFLGVYLITSGKKPSRGVNEDLEEVGDEENTIGLVDEERYQDEIEDDEDPHNTRKSSISFAVDGAKGTHGSRRPSKQEVSSGEVSPGGSIQTPSRTSTASSRASAINEELAPSLLQNPWRSAGRVSTSSHRPRQLEETTSSPLLPSEAQRLGPSTPGGGGQYPLPSTSTRPSTLSRRSVVHLTPGPLMSPLSSSLSAVVADSLRRGVDSPSSQRRPRLSGTRKSRSQRATIDSTGEMATAASALSTAQIPEDAVDTERPTNAGRSLSIGGKMSGFFSLSRQGSKGKSNQNEENSEEDHR